MGREKKTISPCQQPSNKHILVTTSSQHQHQQHPTQPNPAGSTTALFGGTKRRVFATMSSKAHKFAWPREEN